MRGYQRGHFVLENWLVAVKKMLKPSGKIVLLPSMSRQQVEIVDEEYDLKTFYWCPNVDEYTRSYFSRAMQQSGFVVHKDVEGLTQGKAFPLVFVFDD